MPKLTMAIPHRLASDEAIKRIKGLLGEVKMQAADKISGVREEWNGNIGTFSFLAMGFSVSGKVTVQPAQVEISIDLPWAAIPLKAKIEATIKDRATTLLDS